MILNFKEWIIKEMASVSRQKIFLDDDDMAYLKQFPSQFWASALRQRYNELIYKALDHGQLRSDWSDTQTLKVHGPGGGMDVKGREFTVNTGISKLIKRLKMMNYDFSGTNSNNSESLYYSPMSKHTAQSVVKQLKQSAEEMKNEKGHINLDALQNTVSFSPNHLLSKRNDYEPGQEEHMSQRDEFDKLRPSIIKLVDMFLINLSQSDHINGRFWSQGEKREEVINYFLSHIWQNWKDPVYHKIDYIKKVIFNRGRNLLQSGAMSRRTNDYLTKQGTNPTQLMNKINPKTGMPYSVRDIENFAKRNKDKDVLNTHFSNILQNHQDVEPVKAAI